MIQFFRAQWTCASTVAAIAVMLTACGKGQQPVPPAAGDKPVAAPVAIVNGTPIPREVYDVYVKSLLQGKPVSDLTADQRNQVLDDLIKMQLIADQGQKDGLDKDTDVAARLQILRMRVLADAESQKYLKGK